MLIYTGGTIGMKQDVLTQTLKPFDFSQIMEEVPELGKFALKIDALTFDPLIDSSDMEPALWQRLAEMILMPPSDGDDFYLIPG